MMVVRGVMHSCGGSSWRSGRMERSKSRGELQWQETTAACSPRTAYRLPIRHYSESYHYNIIQSVYTITISSKHSIEVCSRITIIDIVNYQHQFGRQVCSSLISIFFFIVIFLQKNCCIFRKGCINFETPHIYWPETKRWLSLITFKIRQPLQLCGFCADKKAS